MAQALLKGGFEAIALAGLKDEHYGPVGEALLWTLLSDTMTLSATLVADGR